MKDEKLVKLSLAVALAGIVALFMIILFIGPDMTTIGSLSEKDAGKHVVLNATVLTKSTSGNNVFMTIYDGTGNITAVVFNARVTVKSGDNVTVTGQVNVYKGELEIIADLVK
ncbi:MAG TPA: OB-fold nucleic acid binding domain-containing protein [archaeon]|nr:OB-fold nucleic acid binding domain-containing protein [archaeon]